MKTSIKVLTSIRGEGGLTPIQETFECVTSGRVVHFDSTRKLPFQQRHFPFLPFFIQRWFHSIIHICWLRKKVVQKQIPITFLNRSDISFSDGREHHLMGVISGMSRRFGRKSHFTLSWRWKHNKLLWSHLTLGIENYVGDLECVISGTSRRLGRKSHLTLSWRGKHSHLTLEIENYVGDHHDKHHKRILLFYEFVVSILT